MDNLKSGNILILKAGRMLRPEGVDPHHIGYTRVRRGKMEKIPQKGAVLKERGEYESKEQEAKNVLGKEYNEFMKNVNGYMHADTEMEQMKNLIEVHVKEKEAFMSKIRPLLTKFDNLSKEEKKFLAIFKSEDFKYRFLSYSRETTPWKDIAEEAIKRLTPKYQAEIEGLKETLKKVTAQEKFTMEKSNPIDKIADHLKNILRIKEEFLRNMKTMSAKRISKSMNYVILEKGRGPDKKPRKRRGKKSLLTRVQNARKDYDQGLNRDILNERYGEDAVKIALGESGWPDVKYHTEPNQDYHSSPSGGMAARQIAQRKMWEGSNYWGPDR